VFNLIIVRVGLGLSQSPGGRGVGSGASREPASAVRFPLQKLNINVSRHVTVEHDSQREAQSSTIMETKDDFSDTEQGQWKSSSVAV
jgi:hypothetical protein